MSRVMGIDSAWLLLDLLGWGRLSYLLNANRYGFAGALFSFTERAIQLAGVQSI